MRSLLTIATLAFVICAPDITRAWENPPLSPQSLAPTTQQMRFVHVRSNDPDCQPDCPERISAEGKIEVGTAQVFARIVNSLGARRLPVLIDSPGGMVVDAMAMGRLIRAKGLAVAVLRTILEPGASPAGSGEARGAAVTLGALCNSACSLMLAGGVERYASVFTFLGVHHVGRVITGDRRSGTAIQQSASAKLEGEISAYLREMGIGPPLMELIEATPATGLHGLSRKERVASRLITISLSDGLSPIVVGPGANGMAELPADPLSGHTAMITAAGSWPFALPVAGRRVTLGARFAFRRGGGVVGYATSPWTRLHADIVARRRCLQPVEA